MEPSEVFNKGMDAEFTKGDIAEAITLYQAAAQLYTEIGDEASAAMCLAAAETAIKDD